MARQQAVTPARRIRAVPQQTEAEQDLDKRLEEADEEAGFDLKDEAEESDEDFHAQFQVLQDEARNAGIVYDPENVTFDELQELVTKFKDDQLKAEQQAQKAALSRPRAEMPEGTAPKSRGSVGRPSARKGGSELDDLKARIRPPDVGIMQAAKLQEPTLEDYRFAAKHNYPVAIPGACAYKIAIDIRCPFGGGDRPRGSVMLLHPIFASNKIEHLTPV